MFLLVFLMIILFLIVIGEKILETKKKNFDDVMKFESKKGGYNYLPVWSYMGKRPAEIREYFSVHSYRQRSVLTGKRAKETKGKGGQRAKVEGKRREGERER